MMKRTTSEWIHGANMLANCDADNDVDGIKTRDPMLDDTGHDTRHDTGHDAAPESAFEFDNADVQDQWCQVLVVKSGPRTLEQIRELDQSENFVSSPVESHPNLASMMTLLQIRAMWFGSIAMDDIQDVAQGDYCWTDLTHIARGLPVVEWSNGLRTVIPFYDWTLDYSRLLPVNPAKPKVKDKWQVHLYALPIKSAHALTYHDCQG